MSSVYVLRSVKTGKRYVGSTSLSPLERLSEHNAGKVPWTRKHRPLKLIYTEVLGSVALARKRELFFKTGKGRHILDSLLGAER
jgi:predicted GIY-YIG superfamily endonuclease